jgi:hypothetical protein
MPSLVRFLVVLAVLAAIGGAGMFYLANFVKPNTREMTVRVPPARLKPQEAVAPEAQPPATAPGGPAQPATEQLMPAVPDKSSGPPKPLKE